MTQIQLPLANHSPNLDPCKTCAACREQQPLAEFSRNASNRDGRNKICRTCDANRLAKVRLINDTKLRAKARRRRAKDLEGNRARNAAQMKTEQGKAGNLLAVRRYAEGNREKIKAQIAVRKAIRSGELDRPSQCARAGDGGCSGRIELHHDDYSRPLDVVALCSAHHCAAHHPALPDYIAPAPLLDCAMEARPPIAITLPDSIGSNLSQPQPSAESELRIPKNINRNNRSIAASASSKRS